MFSETPFNFMFSETLFNFMFTGLMSFGNPPKRNFICELKVERYIYLRNTQKQMKITNYGRNKKFLEFYLV